LTTVEFLTVYFLKKKLLETHLNSIAICFILDRYQYHILFAFCIRGTRISAIQKKGFH